MALHSLRLRRTLSALSGFHRHVSSTSAVSAQTSHSILFTSPVSLSKSPAMISPCWPLRSSSMALSYRSSFGSNTEDDKIGPDTILFEGCDYNHWLITMEFPKDPKPTPEEMVRTYEETCAKGLNIRFYFFSTFVKAWVLELTSCLSCLLTRYTRGATSFELSLQLFMSLYFWNHLNFDCSDLHFLLISILWLIKWRYLGVAMHTSGRKSICHSQDYLGWIVLFLYSFQSQRRCCWYEMTPNYFLLNINE